MLLGGFVELRKPDGKVTRVKLDGPAWPSLALIKEISKWLITAAVFENQKSEGKLKKAVGNEHRGDYPDQHALIYRMTRSALVLGNVPFRTDS